MGSNFELFFLYWISHENPYLHSSIRYQISIIVFLVSCKGSRSHTWNSYCKSTIVHGVPIFVDFVGKVNHKIWFPTKRIIFFKLHDRIIKTTNSIIHKLLLFLLTKKIDTHEYKFFLSNFFMSSCFFLYFRWKFIPAFFNQYWNIPHHFWVTRAQRGQKTEDYF